MGSPPGHYLDWNQVSSTNPASESSSQERSMARWYETFLMVCQAAQRRGLGIIAHHDHKQALMDMMERVAEDPLYTAKFGKSLPPLVFYSKMPKGEFRMIDPETRKVLTMTEAMRSNRGVGRIQRIWTPDAAIKKGSG